MAIDLTKMRELTPEELYNEELALREEIWKLRLAQATGQLQNGRKVRDKRHDLARLLGVQTELERNASKR